MDVDIAILFLISALFGIASKAFVKICSNIVPNNSAAKYSLVLVVNSIVGCAFFMISGGFALAFTVETLVYSLVFALIVTGSIILGIVSHRYASIMGVNVLSSTLNVACTAVIGWVFLSEKLGASGILRVLVVCEAAVIEFINQYLKGKKKNGDKREGGILPLILVIAAISLIGCMCTVTLKLFSMSQNVTDENSFFFLTNAVLCVGAAVVFLIACLVKKDEFRGAISLLHPKRVVLLAGNTACGNITTLISALIIARMDVAVYSPISFAVGILAGLVGSLIFKERLGILSYVAAVVACLAMVI